MVDVWQKCVLMFENSWGWLVFDESKYQRVKMGDNGQKLVFVCENPWKCVLFAINVWQGLKTQCSCWKHDVTFENELLITDMARNGTKKVAGHFSSGKTKRNQEQMMQDTDHSYITQSR